MNSDSLDPHAAVIDRLKNARENCDPESGVLLTDAIAALSQPVEQTTKQDKNATNAPAPPLPPAWAVEAAKELLSTHTIPIHNLLEGCAAIIGRHAPSTSAGEERKTELEVEVVRLRVQLESMDKEVDELMRERDAAESVADTMAAAVLGEGIDWSDHEGKWTEAIDEAAGTVTELADTKAALRDSQVRLQACHENYYGQGKDLESLRAALVTSQDRVTELKGRVAELEEQSGTYIKKSDENYGALVDECDQLRAQLAKHAPVAAAPVAPELVGRLRTVADIVHGWEYGGEKINEADAKWIQRTIQTTIAALTAQQGLPEVVAESGLLSASIAREMNAVAQLRATEQERDALTTEAAALAAALEGFMTSESREDYPHEYRAAKQALAAHHALAATPNKGEK